MNYPAKFPADEAKRLDALERLGILDTLPEDFFEDVVDSVQLGLDAPIVLISLVDEHRQWFKARRGLGVQETPRDMAFCAYAILEDRSLIVSDSLTDRRFNRNPLATGEPFVRSYAGAPIKLACGSRIGTVCAIHHEPHVWRQKEVDHLERSARLISRHLDARRASIEQDRSKFLERSLIHTQTKYRAMQNAMSEGMVVHGASGSIVDFNEAACELLGLAPEELFGRVSKDSRWRAITPEGCDFPGKLHPAMVSLRTGEPVHNVTMGIETPQGERRWLIVSSFPVRDHFSHKVQQVVAVFRRVENVAANGA